MAKAKFKADLKHTKLLKAIGKASAQRAILETKALNLPITYLENGTIYQESPDGKKIVLGTI